MCENCCPARPGPPETLPRTRSQGLSLPVPGQGDPSDALNSPLQAVIFSQ